MQFDRVSFATSTTGTGTVTAGAATSGFRTPAQAAIPDGTSVTYAIEDGAAWETGTGVVGASGTTLTRVVSQSSNANSLLNLSGSAKVFLTPIASDYNGLGKILPVAGRIRRSTAQSISAGAGFTAISFDVAALQQGGTFFNPAFPTEVIIPETGTYYFSVEATGAAPGLTVQWDCELRVDAAVIGAGSFTAGAGETAPLKENALRLCAAGQKVTFHVRHNNAGAMNISSDGDHSPDILLFKIGGVGASPGGNSGELQYNNSGAFAGAANVGIDTGNLKLVSTSDPVAPTGGLMLYSKSIAGRHLPKIIGPSGIDTILQVGLSGNAVFMLAPQTGTTAPLVWGGTLSTLTTMSVQLTIASANPWQATWRKRFSTAATAASQTGCRTAYVQWFRGSAAGFGGFFFRAQLGQNINLNGSQCFVGLCALTTAMVTSAGAVSALVNSIGMGYDTTDASTGNWFLVRNDGSGTATKVDLGTGAARNTTHGYDLIIYCPPGAATEIFVRVVNIHTGAVVLDTSYTTDIPAVNVGLAFKAECNNGAVAAATNLEIAKVYIESDY